MKKLFLCSPKVMYSVCSKRAVWKGGQALPAVFQKVFSCTPMTIKRMLKYTISFVC